MKNESSYPGRMYVNENKDRGWILWIHVVNVISNLYTEFTHQIHWWSMLEGDVGLYTMSIKGVKECLPNNLDLSWNDRYLTFEKKYFRKIKLNLRVKDPNFWLRFLYDRRSSGYCALVIGTWMTSAKAARNFYLDKDDSMCWWCFLIRLTFLIYVSWLMFRMTSNVIWQIFL